MLERLRLMVLLDLLDGRLQEHLRLNRARARCFDLRLGEGALRTAWSCPNGRDRPHLADGDGSCWLIGMVWIATCRFLVCSLSARGRAAEPKMATASCSIR